MDKLSEWILETVEQGNDRPIETSNKKTGGKQDPKGQKPSFNKKKNFKKGKTSQGKPGQRNSGPAKTNPAQKAKGHNPQKKNNQKRSTPFYQRKQSPSKKKIKKISQAFKGLRIIPIGGLDEVGKNMTVFEYNRTGQPKDKEIIIIDMGFQFPEDDMLGVDYVIPDSTYLEENKKKIRAVIITHGHLDHTGGIPYILPKIDYPPVFATRLTRGLIEERIKEFKIERNTKLNTIDPTKSLKFGSFKVDFFRVAHSIPDAVGVIIDTPEGKVVHTGDFKFDDSPAGNQPKADLHKLRALGKQNVLALFSDSTNALKPGHTMSESEVGRNLESLIKQAQGRIIIASFSSLIGRIQQIFDYAERSNRKIYISGRSMKNNINIALKLGFLKIKTNLMRDIKKVKDAPDNEVIIITTGSQGEASSALTRISANDHPQVKIKKGDKVIVSSSPIIGNERAISTVANNLCKLGAQVIHSQIMDVHTSGHGCQDELLQMMQMVNPKYLIPIHGEYFMRQAHKEIGIKYGIPEQNCIVVQNGGILEIANRQVKVSKEEVEANDIFIDGLGEGTIGSRVIIERQKMSLNGILAVILSVNKKTKQLKEQPNIISRGFMYMHEYEEITAELADLVESSYKAFVKKRPDANRKDVKKYISSVAEKYTYQKIERRPLILPLIFES